MGLIESAWADKGSRLAVLQCAREHKCPCDTAASNFASGHIAFRADAGTWSFVPDKFWKQGSGGRKHVGYIEHPVAVVVFRRSAAHPAGGDEEFDFPAFKNTVEA